MSYPQKPPKLTLGRANGASVEDILLKRIDTLEDEVSKLRDELAQTKQKHSKELEQIRGAVGLIPVDEEELPDSTTFNTEFDTPEPTKDTALISSVEQESPAVPLNTCRDLDSADLNSTELGSADLNSADLNSADLNSS